MSMLDVAVPAQWKRQIEDLQVQLRDPFKLRVVVLSLVAGLGLIGVYRPMSAELAIVRRDLKAAEDRLALVRQIEQLRTSRAKLLENLPQNGDINFWSEYLLGGIRDSGVILKTLESSYRKTKVGKLQNVYFDIEVAGTFEQIYHLIAWLETEKYTTRLTKLRIKGEHQRIEARFAVSVLVAHSGQKAKSPSEAGKSDGKPTTAAPKSEGHES